MYNVANEEIVSDLCMGTDSFCSLQGLKTLIKRTKFILVQSWVVAFLKSVYGTKILQNGAFYNYRLPTIFLRKKKQGKHTESIEVGNLRYEFCIADFISALGKSVIRKTNWRL